MEDIKVQLTGLFEEMLTYLDKFNRHEYNDAFLTAFKKYEAFFESVAVLCENTSREDRKVLIEEIALIIPVYVKELMNGIKKREKNKVEMNYNMNMAAYIIPAFTYSQDFYLEKIAKRMVELWNEKQVTSLTLGYSSYEEIVKGFKWKLCYITTAVCEHQNKPDDCYELTLLRDYRDEYLLKSLGGREIVDEYYDIAPGIVMMINMQKNADEIYQHVYQKYLTPCIRHIEEGRNEECRKIYMQMVRTLKKQYLYS